VRRGRWRARCSTSPTARLCCRGVRVRPMRGSGGRFRRRLRVAGRLGLLTRRSARPGTPCRGGGAEDAHWDVSIRWDEVERFAAGPGRPASLGAAEAGPVGEGGIGRGGGVCESGGAHCMPESPVVGVRDDRSGHRITGSPDHGITGSSLRRSARKAEPGSSVPAGRVGFLAVRSGRGCCWGWAWASAVTTGRSGLIRLSVGLSVCLAARPGPARLLLAGSGWVGGFGLLVVGSGCWWWVRLWWW